jgi:carbonic anhydrase
MITLFWILATMTFAHTPSQSLQRLVDGNQRYVNDTLLRPNHSSDRREEVLAGQQPFAIILGCSDSRVPPEIIFDQGVGDLFMVRIAGNVVGSVGLDSIEYAAKYLGSSLVMVLGHESCGAVTAVLQGNTVDIEAIADLIKPAIKGMTRIEDAVKANVRWVVQYLKQSDVLKKLISQKKLDCVGAYYHLGTGEVEILK